MTKGHQGNSKNLLLAAGTELIRRNGFVATTVEDICAQAGVTKGAFFHHFVSKEALADACLKLWDEQTAAMDKGAAFQEVSDAVDRVFACIDFYIALFENPELVKSCLAGTTVQEVSESHDGLREASNTCLVNAQSRFKSLIDAASAQTGAQLDSHSIAGLWMATIQGSLILCKASRDDLVIRRNLTHFKEFLRALLSRAKIDRV